MSTLAPPRPAPPRSCAARRRRSVVVPAAMLGTAATAAGAGLGVRHLQKTGVSVVTVAGLLTLAVGLALLVLAARGAWRALRGWRRLWLVPATVLVLVGVSSGGLAVAFTVVPPTSLGSATPATYGMSYAQVALRTGDGVRLSAWLVPSRNGAALVVRHGAGSTRTATLRQAAVLAGHGYGLLIVDARGHGRSEGRGMDLGWYGDRDVVAAVSFLRRQPGVEAGRIGVVGLSMGGEEAIGAAAADDRIQAVVAEGATARTAEDKAGWLPGGVPGTIQRAIDRLTFGLTDLLTPAGPPRSLVDAVTRAEQTRFLLITAEEMPDESRAAEHLRRAAPDRVEVWDVPGASHTDGLREDPAGWERRVVAFLNSALGRAPAATVAADRY